MIPSPICLTNRQTSQLDTQASLKLNTPCPECMPPLPPPAGGKQVPQEAPTPADYHMELTEEVIRSVCQNYEDKCWCHSSELKIKAAFSQTQWIHNPEIIRKNT